jgi:hypothetical protein
VKHWRVWLVGILVVRLVAVTWWAVRPVSETVPTGRVRGVQTHHTVQCDSPLSGNGSATGPLPQLRPGQEYERTPCERTVNQDRILFFLDVALALLVFIALAATWKPQRVTRPVEMTPAA